MKTGILGGVFDPPHNGHLALARRAIDRFGLDRLLVLVADRPGHKGVVLDGQTRLRLARAAFAGLPQAEVSLDEHAFTIDLVGDGGFRDARFIVGADEFAHFPSWKQPDGVLANVRLAVGTRPGYPRALLENVRDRFGPTDRVDFFELDQPVDASSTEARERASRGEPIDDLVPPAVARLVSELGLYREAGVH